MHDERYLSFKAQLENIPPACEFVVEAAEAAGLDERATYHCQLAVDETCTNIIEHGFTKSQHGHLGTIDIVTGVDDDSFIIVISDNSPAFNPLTHDDPNPSEDLANRAPGGWGIYFIKKLMDAVDYRFVEDKNQLTLRKAIAVHRAPVRPPTSELTISSKPLPKNYLQINLVGRLDSQTSPKVEYELKTIINDKGYQRLIVNLTEVDYVSSSGLKVLVSAWRLARQHAGDVILTDLQPRIREVFEMIGFDMMFHIYDSPGDVIADDPISKN